ncbi:MAG TPA: hypothetical protein VIK78_14385 [Ruminiclostridium sp.]
MSKTMVRIVKDKNNPYVILNKGFLNDTNLTWQAKGMISYLMSLPDDWKIYESEITTHSQGGVKYVSSIMKELINYGYMKRDRLKSENGRFTGYEYCVYEVSSIMPQTENGDTENGERQTTNKNLTNNDLTKYKKDNGISSNDKNTHTISYPNEDVVKAMKTYMNDFYRQKTKKKHPFLKPEQYKSVYNSISSTADEWGLEYQALIDMMLKFLNTKTIQSDWNINHFATEGIMVNRMYEVAY